MNRHKAFTIGLFAGFGIMCIITTLDILTDLVEPWGYIAVASVSFFLILLVHFDVVDPIKLRKEAKE